MARGRRMSPKNRQDTNKMTGQIRLIGGKWRGRKLPVPDLAGLRPTTDRVRETLFNWLMGELPGARVLDCFAGSGALSLEALSRHATHATLFEKDLKAAKQLEQNLKTLGHDDAKVICDDSLTLLTKPCAHPFNLVFVDPPFRQNLTEPTCQLLDSNNYVGNGSWIYVETEAELTLSIPTSWQPYREKIAGQVAYRLFQKQQ